MPANKPSIFSVLLDLALVINEQMTLDALVAVVHARRESSGPKSTAQTIERINVEYHKAGFIRLHNGNFYPLRLVLPGTTFRIIPDAEAIRGEYLLSEWFVPYLFFGLVIYHGRQPMHLDYRNGSYGTNGWMAEAGVKLGDHIIVTIDEHTKDTFHFAVDRARDIHLHDTVDAERAILSAFGEIPQDRFDMMHASAAFFATIAHASWRTQYPCRPWDVLYEMARQGQFSLDLQGEAIKDAIATLQQAMRQRRSADVARGIWDGMAPRYSAVRLAIDTNEDDAMGSRVNVPAVDMRLDFSSRIEESLAKGLYDVSMGNEDADEDPADQPYSAIDQSDASYTSALHSDYDDEDGDDSMFDADVMNGEELDDDTFAMLFANRHPALEAWSSTLLRSMKPIERRLMVRAESDDDYNAVLTVALQRLLPQTPSFMQTLRTTTEMPSLDPTQGGQSYAAFQVAEYDAAQAVELPEDISPMNDDDVFATGGEALFAVETALRESESLLKRYTAHLEADGLASSTVRRKVQFVRGFAQFLARYYTRALDAASYAMMDEYVFFYYPRHTTAVAPRNARNLLSALRDFYKTEATRLLPVAQALYEAHEQAEEVLRLLERTHHYPNEMTALVVHLFAPYTA